MTRFLRTSVVAACLCALAVLTACTSTSTPDKPPTPPPHPTTSASAPAAPAQYSLGAKWVWADFDKVKPFLQDLGRGDTYVEVVLCDVQPTKGSFDWKVPDRNVSRARDIGFGSLVKLRTGRCWATPGAAKTQRGAGVTESAMPADMSVYNDFVDQAVRRYSAMGVTEFAVENEVNSPYFWDGTPEQYATLARAAAKAIHAAAPDAVVVDGSVSSAGAGYAVASSLLEQGRDDDAVSFYQSYYARRFGTRDGSASIDKISSVANLRTELARPLPASAVAFMKAIDQLVRDGVFQARQVHFYETWQSLPTTLQVLRHNTPESVPLEMWELGIWDADRSVSAAQRTAEVVKATVIALGAGVTKVLWLPLQDNPDGRLAATLTGLVGPAGESTGSSHAFSLLAKALQGQVTITPVAEKGLMGATITSTPSSMVLWSTEGDRALATVPGGSGTTLDDKTPASAGGPATASVGTQPVLITTTGAVSAFEGIAK